MVIDVGKYQEMLAEEDKTGAENFDSNWSKSKNLELKALFIDIMNNSKWHSSFDKQNKNWKACM